MRPTRYPTEWGRGGAVFVDVGENNSASLQGVDFIGNSASNSAGFAAEGGALVLAASGRGSYAECVGCNFVGNSLVSTAAGSVALGGAARLWAYASAAVVLRDCRFTSNSATNAAGAQTPVLAAVAYSDSHIALDRLVHRLERGWYRPLYLRRDPILVLGQHHLAGGLSTDLRRRLGTPRLRRLRNCAARPPDHRRLSEPGRANPNLRRRAGAPAELDRDLQWQRSRHLGRSFPDHQLHRRKSALYSTGPTATTTWLPRHPRSTQAPPE